MVFSEVSSNFPSADHSKHLCGDAQDTYRPQVYDADNDCWRPWWVATKMISSWNSKGKLVGGFKHFLFSSLFGEMIQFD